MRTTLISAYLLLRNPRGVFIGAKGTRGQETRCDPKRRARRGRIAAETRQMSLFRGSPWAARAAPPAARYPVAPLSAKAPGFGFVAPDFDRICSLGQ